MGVECVFASKFSMKKSPLVSLPLSLPLSLSLSRRLSISFHALLIDKQAGRQARQAFHTAAVFVGSSDYLNKIKIRLHFNFHYTHIKQSHYTQPLMYNQNCFISEFFILFEINTCCIKSHKKLQHRAAVYYKQLLKGSTHPTLTKSQSTISIRFSQP